MVECGEFRDLLFRLGELKATSIWVELGSVLTEKDGEALCQ